MTRTNYETHTEDETIKLGAELARGWSLPVVVLLIGNLGAGKTTLAKGIAEGLGITTREEVSSPTFPLVHEYGERGELSHVDLYRLDTAEEVESLGLDETMERSQATLLEWAEKFIHLMPAQRIEIRIESCDDDSRLIEVTDLP